MAQPHGSLRSLAHERERLGQEALVGLAGNRTLAQTVGRSAQFGIRQRGEAVFKRVDLVDYTAILPKTPAVAEREQLGYGVGHGKKPPGETWAGISSENADVPSQVSRMRGRRRTRSLTRQLAIDCLRLTLRQGDARALCATPASRMPHGQPAGISSQQAKNETRLGS